MQEQIELLSDDENDEEKYTSFAKHLALRRHLIESDIRDLSFPHMLTDRVINAAQTALKSAHGDQTGRESLQDTVLGQVLHFQSSGGLPFVQILHDGNYHWVAVTTYGCNPGEIYLMDSMVHYVGKRSKRSKPRIRIHGHVKEQICDLLRSPAASIQVKVERVEQQNNGVDCGLFAIAFCQYVLVNKR